MNLRQKNKKLKQELEWYKKQMVPTREVRFDSRRMRVETLRANNFYNKDMIDYLRDDNPEAIPEMFREDLIDQLEPYLEECIQFKLIHRKDLLNTYEVIGKIKVVVPDGGDGF